MINEDAWRHIDAVYLLCHPDKEQSRWQRLLEHLEARGVPKEKCICAGKTWGDTLDERVLESLYDPFLKRPGCPYLSWKGRGLLLGEVSLVLNFWMAADHAIKSGYSCILILESDVYLRDDFNKRMGSLMTLLLEPERSWDYVSLSDGVGTHAERSDLKTDSIYAPTGVYKPPHQFPFRCTDSMLFRVDILKKMRMTAFPFRECLDWELNYQLAIHGGVPLWVEPHFVEQGTCKKRMVTTLPA
jgi:hypothetical protein